MLGRIGGVGVSWATVHHDIKDSVPVMAAAEALSIERLKKVLRVTSGIIQIIKQKRF